MLPNRQALLACWQIVFGFSETLSQSSLEVSELLSLLLLHEPLQLELDEPMSITWVLWYFMQSLCLPLIRVSSMAWVLLIFDSKEVISRLSINFSSAFSRVLQRLAHWFEFQPRHEVMHWYGIRRQFQKGSSKMSIVLILILANC